VRRTCAVLQHGGMRDALAVCACQLLFVCASAGSRCAGRVLCCDTVVCVMRLLYVRVNCCLCAHLQAAGAQDVCCVVTRWYA